MNPELDNRDETNTKLDKMGRHFLYAALLKKNELFLYILTRDLNTQCYFSSCSTDPEDKKKCKGCDNSNKVGARFLSFINIYIFPNQREILKGSDWHTHAACSKLGYQ